MSKLSHLQNRVGQPHNDQRTVIVVGGGASGMMAAIAAARCGASVTLLEKNKHVGEKLSITGGGRCNIMNAQPELRILLANYGKSEKFLFSAYTQFGTAETEEFFNSIGIALKVEARNRAFPVSEDALEVVAALRKEMLRLCVTVLTDTAVLRLKTNSTSIQGAVTSLGEFTADSYILATGGLSRPETGSTGDGFTWLSHVGHTVKEPNPSITPLSVKNGWQKTLSGSKAIDAEVSFFLDGKQKHKVRGDVLFTHFGLSGPVILNNAYRVAELLQAGDVEARFNLYPGIPVTELHSRIISTFEQNTSKQLKNVVKDFTPQGLALLPEAVIGNDIDWSVKTSEVSKKQRERIVQSLVSAPLTIDSLMGFDKAVVADGGIPLEEIHMRTMQSKTRVNLYILGDLLHINRPSGGYSLQLCWTTGHVAGVNAAKSSIAE